MLYAEEKLNTSLNIYFGVLYSQQESKKYLKHAAASGTVPLGSRLGLFKAHSREIEYSSLVCICVFYTRNDRARII